MRKKVLLAVSFGTTHLQTRQKTIEATERALGQAFADYEVRRAFTSSIVRQRILKKEQLQIEDPEQALERAAKEGVQEVVLVSLHLLPGEEYHKMYQAARKWQARFEKLTISQPLLHEVQDYQRLAKMLGEFRQEQDIEPGQALLLGGHGSRHAANAAYGMMAYLLEHTSTTPNTYVATIEGWPLLPDAIESMRERSIRRVTILPFMLVAGDHAVHDLASTDENSWSSQLERAGFSVQMVMQGLGEFKEVHQMFIDKARLTLA